jgi:hypothetical protein
MSSYLQEGPEEEWEPTLYSIQATINVSGAEPIPRRLREDLTYVPDKLVVSWRRKEFDDWEFTGLGIVGFPVNAGGRVYQIRRYSENYRLVEDLHTLPTWIVDIVNRSQPRGIA